MSQIYFRHESLREQQKSLIEDAYGAIEGKENLLAHAPVGLGKTDSLLSPAISYAIEHNKTVFFLTPKISQHRIAMDVVLGLEKKYELDLRAVDLIGRKYACIDPILADQDSEGFYQSCERKRKKEECQFYRNAKGYTRLDEARAERLFKKVVKKYGPGMHHEQLVELGCQNEACAYEWLTQLASLSNVVIADYFHMMLPQIRDVLLLKIKKKLKDSIIIVDEAHNLSKRVRDQLSVSTNTFLLKNLDKELKFLGLKSNFETKFRRWAKQELGNAREKLISKEKFYESLANEEYTPEELADYLEGCGEAFIEATGKKSFSLRFARFIQSWREPKDLSPSVRILRRKGDHYFLAKKALDPSPATSKMNEAHSAILTSGTLLPLEMHRDVLGLDPEKTKLKTYASPFQRKNKMNIILDGFTTRYSQRDPEQFARIAKMLDEVILKSPGGVALFFPSYKVLNAVIPFMKSKNLHVQWERMRPSEVGELLKNFRERGTLCAVQGGSLSVSYDEPIILKKGNEILLTPIGEFVDRTMERGEVTTKKGIERSVPDEKYEVCAFDPKTFKIKFKPLSKVIRHKIKEPLLEVTLQTGRKVKATPSHSIFALKNGEVCAPPVSELKVGDFVIIPKTLPSGELPKELDILESMLALPASKISNLYMQGQKECLDLEKLKNAGYSRMWKYRDTAPLELLTKEVWLTKPTISEIHIRWGHKLKTNIPLSPQLFRLLGYYVAEGHHVRGRHSCIGLTFGSHETELIEDAKQCIEDIFGVAPSIQSSHSATQLIFGGKLARLFFVDILKAGERAGNKRVPPIVLSASAEQKLEFLRGYIAGDGTISKTREISCKTISKMLASDLLYLFLQLGIFASCTEIPAKGTHKKSYWLCVSNADQLEKLLPILSESDKKKVEKYISESKQNKKRRTLHPDTIPVEESGLGELFEAARPLQKLEGTKIRNRVHNTRLRRDLFSETFQYILKERRDSVNSSQVKQLEHLIGSDFGFAQIKSIKKINSPSEYVYDVSVSGFENFVGGFGGIILHNSEGVDYNQGEIKTAVIVGIALDEMSLEVESLIQHYDEKFGQGWNYGYLYPGVTKAIQSAGRAIRKETDRAVVIYMDERFNWKNYKSMLPREERFVTSSDPTEFINCFWSK